MGKSRLHKTVIRPAALYGRQMQMLTTRNEMKVQVGKFAKVNIEGGWGTKHRGRYMKMKNKSIDKGIMQSR